MFHKSGGPYVIKTHQLPAQHQARATELQASGTAVHLAADLAHPVLQQLAQRQTVNASKRLLADEHGQLGLGYGTFVVDDLLVSHHPQHGVTLWAETPEPIQACLQACVTARPVPSLPSSPAPTVSSPALPSPPMRYTLRRPDQVWQWQPLGAPLPDVNKNFPLHDLAYLQDMTAPWMVELVGNAGSAGRQMVGALACQHGWNVLETDVEPQYWPALPPGRCVVIVSATFPRQYLPPNLLVFVLTTSSHRVPSQHAVHLGTRATKCGITVEQLFGCPPEHVHRVQPIESNAFSSMYE